MVYLAKAREVDMEEVRASIASQQDAGKASAEKASTG